MDVAPVLIGGSWVESAGEETFRPVDPATTAPLAEYPVSPWDELDRALAVGGEAFAELRAAGPGPVAAFLDDYARRIEARRDELVEMAHSETALPASPRLAEIELPRTTDQLRQAAQAARLRSWVRPTLSPPAGIASMLAPIPGVVIVLGPNNFPFAFNGVSGGDFAAAMATGHPVIAKANPGHPGTTRLLAEEASAAVAEAGLPPALVQMFFHTSPEDGARLVADARVAVTAYTGSRRGGLALKAAADQAGIPIYVEMSSVNPTVVLPGAWAERGEAIAEELAGSILLGGGQFCTKPGLVLTTSGPHARGLRRALGARLEDRPPGTLLAPGVLEALESARLRFEEAGAEVVAQRPADAAGLSFGTTLLGVDGGTFLEQADALQREAFGNLALVVEASDMGQLRDALTTLEGQLAGSIYAATDGSDEEAYRLVEPVLRERVGRLLNDKPPTGVAVVAAMNHGGPFPATGHPGFTAVGIPVSLERFGMLAAYDNVADHRLPPELQAPNPLGIPRLVDGEWTRDPIRWGG